MTSKIPESCSREEIQSFLTELGNLLKKHGVEIYAGSDALDDSGLESWLEFTKTLKKKKGEKWLIAKTDCFNGRSFPCSFEDIYIFPVY